jgi:DNA mismatch repair protein MSH5
MHGIPTELVERARVVRSVARLLSTQLTDSDCVSKFQITKLIDAQLTDEDMDELAQAEDLTKRFLAWEPHDDDPDLRDQLALMFEVADEPEEVLELGEGASGVTTLERRALSEAATRSAMEEIKEEDEENEEDGIDA